MMLPQNLKKFKRTLTQLKLFEPKNIKVYVLRDDNIIGGFGFDKDLMTKFIKDNRMTGELELRRVSKTFIGFLTVNFKYLPPPKC